MSKLPTEMKLSRHAQQRLLERKGDTIKYNITNLMKSPVKWYTTDDLIPNSSLYIHSKYVCRKVKDKRAYMTDGNIEVLYDKNVNVAITILNLKDKFKPISQYIESQDNKIINRKEN